MDFIASEKIILDYGGAVGGEKLLRNLSGVAVDGARLWTVSDEGRTLECLESDGERYRLRRQYRVDDLVHGLPGRQEDEPAELDLEAISLDGDMLWFAGSHCLVRKADDNDKDAMFPTIRTRESRFVLARAEIRNGDIVRTSALPWRGPESLRQWLKGDSYLDPFLDLPSKENGLDIEGLAARDNRVMLGCRGPLLDSRAVVIELTFDETFTIDHYALHFLDLDGLGIRDLCWQDDQLLVKAGPTSDARGLFGLYRWSPTIPGRVEHPERLLSFLTNTEKPEGVCPLARGGREGLIVLYDSPDGPRWNQDMTYEADWMAYP